MTYLLSGLGMAVKWLAVTDVVSGSIADALGFAVGDEIVRINGEFIMSDADIVRILDDAVDYPSPRGPRFTKEVTILVRRNARSLTITIPAGYCRYSSDMDAVLPIRGAPEPKCKCPAPWNQHDAGCKWKIWKDSSLKGALK